MKNLLQRKLLSKKGSIINPLGLPKNYKQTLLLLFAFGLSSNQSVNHFSEGRERPQECNFAIKYHDQDNQRPLTDMLVSS